MPATPHKTNRIVPEPVTYAELQSQLDHVLIELQRDDLDVDKALQYYQQGVELVQQLEQYLKTARNKISELKIKPGLL